MKRRGAIKRIASGVSAGLILPSLPGLFSSCDPSAPQPEVRYDGVVGILGAGISGLYAADILRSKGINVRVFEATDRVGGRIRSIRFTDNAPISTDFPIELGAERVLGSNSLWNDIIAQMNIPVVDFTDIGVNHFILDDGFYREDELMADGDFANAKAFVDNLASQSATGSVLDAINAAGIPERLHAIVNSLIGNKYGVQNANLGMLGVSQSVQARQRDSRELLLRSNPMQDVVQSRFSSVLPYVEFNSVITSVDYSGDRVLLTGMQDGTDFNTEVDKLVIAVPLSILKTAIAFSPALPTGKQQALGGLDMSAAVKVVMDFKRNFWSNDCAYIYGHPNLPELFTTGLGRSELNKSLSLTVFGDKAEEISAKGPDAIPYILAELDAVFDNKATPNIRLDDDGAPIYEMVDWTAEPYIQGGISYIRPGASHDHRVALAEPVDSVLYFAGEAADVSGDAGTVNGALVSAQRVAQEVVDSILAQG